MIYGWDHLGQNVVHCLRGARITFPQYSQQSEDLDLQERIGNSGDIMLGRVSRHYQVLRFHQLENFEIAYCLLFTFNIRTKLGTTLL